MNKIPFILLVAITLLLGACEYEPGGSNFVEIEQETVTPVSITLNDINPSDTVFIYQSTNINIKVNSAKELVQAEVLLDGEQITTMYSNQLSFSISPYQYSEGVHKLSIKATLASGTGSLADMMGLEYFWGELSWNFYIVKNIEDKFKFDYRINDDGFMELYWSNLIPDNYIQSYTVQGSYSQDGDIIITDASQKTYVDYGYVCGNGYYDVKIILKDGNIFWKYLSIDSPTPGLYFEDIDLERLRVFWDKPLANARFNLFIDDEVYVTEMVDTSIVVSQYFGEMRSFKLEIKPRMAEYDNLYNTTSVYERNNLGMYLELPNWPLYAYNKTENIIYTTRYSSLLAFDANSMEIINSIVIEGNPWGLIYGGKLASAPHNGTVAAMTGEETWILPNSQLGSSVVIPGVDGDIHTRLAALTSNDQFFVVQGKTNICTVYNSLNGAKEGEFTFTYNTVYDMPDFDTVSDDGKYFCSSSDTGMEVLEVNGVSTTVVYTDTREYSGAMFVPSHPDQLLLRVGSVIELRQMPDFTLLQQMEVTNDALLCNIDPATTNLLYYQNDSLRVCNVDHLSETLFKIRTNEKYCKMFNSKIVTYGNGGLCLDIEPYLNE
nr:hypothetical protein [uncultured Carboxylicivirga sp.]